MDLIAPIDHSFTSREADPFTELENRIAALDQTLEQWREAWNEQVPQGEREVRPQTSFSTYFPEGVPMNGGTLWSPEVNQISRIWDRLPPQRRFEAWNFVYNQFLREPESSVWESQRRREELLGTIAQSGIPQLQQAVFEALGRQANEENGMRQAIARSVFDASLDNTVRLGLIQSLDAPTGGRNSNHSAQSSTNVPDEVIKELFENNGYEEALLKVADYEAFKKEVVEVREQTQLEASWDEDFQGLYVRVVNPEKKAENTNTIYRLDLNKDLNASFGPLTRHLAYPGSKSTRNVNEFYFLKSADGQLAAQWLKRPGIEEGLDRISKDWVLKVSRWFEKPLITPLKDRERAELEAKMAKQSPSSHVPGEAIERSQSPAAERLSAQNRRLLPGAGRGMTL
jgi:hypothetical protein